MSLALLLQASYWPQAWAATRLASPDPQARPEISHPGGHPSTDDREVGGLSYLALLT